MFKTADGEQTEDIGPAGFNKKTSREERTWES
jgi:hypothetical protein